MSRVNIYTFLFCTTFLAIGCYAQQASYPKSKILQKNFSSNLKDQLRELEKDQFKYEILFLDATDEVLVKRFKEKTGRMEEQSLQTNLSLF